MVYSLCVWCLSKVDKPSSWNLMHTGVWSSKEAFTLDPEEGGNRAVGYFVCSVCSSSKGDLYSAERARVNLLMHIHTGLTITHIVKYNFFKMDLSLHPHP